MRTVKTVRSTIWGEILKDEFLRNITPRIHHGIDIYTKSPTFPGNCGDLIFSGHMLLLVLLTKISSTSTYNLFYF